MTQTYNPRARQAIRAAPAKRRSAQTRDALASSPKAALACDRRIDQLLDVRLFRALSDPTRTLLLACIAKCGRACSVSEVAECCSVDFSVVSRHLAMLARAGVLTASKAGRIVRYEVRYREIVAALRDLAASIEQCCPNQKGPSRGCC
ncbi:MAG: winged helix-turn-helix transcriptional regulator [Phycisphaerales bacterium]|nr:winged helix-turn-helix transcriptional regulator [Phycisphaerales bacterium]